MANGLHKQPRGSVGIAAVSLREALAAKLQPGVKDSPINNAVYQAIKLVDAFLLARKEGQQDLDILKSQIKRIMMSQISGQAPPPVRQLGPSRGASSPAILGDQLPLPRSQLVVTSKPPSHPDPQASEGAAAGSSGDPAGSARLQLYSRTGSRSTGSGSLDWTLPQHTLNRKAHVRFGEYGRMALVQDELARKADAARAAEAAERRRATMAVAAEAMQMLERRREEQRDARRREREEMDETMRLFQLEEGARLARQRAHQAEVRGMYASQVAERQARKQCEADQRLQEAAADRQRLQAEEARERQRLEQASRTAAAAHESLRQELLGAMRAKAAAKAALVEEENRYNKERVAVMDAEEAARKAVFAKRQERMRIVNERAGGAALQASLEEQERASAERAARLAAEVEAAAAERERRDTERRRTVAAEALRGLNAQMAAKEAARREAEAAEAEARRALRAAEAAAKAAAEEAKAARRRARAEELAAQKAAAMEQHRRRFIESQELMDERHRWLHAGPLAGEQRAFNNLAVPPGKAALLASMTI